MRNIYFVAVFDFLRLCHLQQYLLSRYLLFGVCHMCSFIPASKRQTSHSWYFIYLTHFRKYPHNFSLLYLVFSATDENCFQYNNSLCGYLYLRYQYFQHFLFSLLRPSDTFRGIPSDFCKLILCASAIRYCRYQILQILDNIYTSQGEHLWSVSVSICKYQYPRID